MQGEYFVNTNDLLFSITYCVTDYRKIYQNDPAQKLRNVNHKKGAMKH